jgi:hypothetical protein
MSEKPHLEAALANAKMLLSIARSVADPARSRNIVAWQFCQTLCNPPFDPVAAMPIIDEAKLGDLVAKAAVHHAIIWFVEGRVPLPEPLAAYLKDLLIGQDLGPKKRPRHGNYLRDDLIRLVVGVVESHGFHRTRNPATRDKTADAVEAQSACSIVRDVLEEFGINLSEKTIEGIAGQSSG